ncbi:DUF6792 domain-containing protein [Pseudalkalibacillus decolorationis]|uniref:DUF6792 domain-containing protein n=1 Tax=Pseudalkalibacillus decolorationis TaxID=163879 RepID=UPI002147E3DC|nr:DUF6792 domain-containing protein [Pseudalkalibacillus decolorationis]
MGNEEILKTEELRLRITNLGYKDIDETEFKKELRRIYFEETGKEIPVDINIIRSDDIIKADSGYDGTAIHFQNENGINQVYIISEGSADVKDWGYNLIGIFAGKDGSQYEDAKKFYDSAMKEIKGKSGSKKEIISVGLAHSLAHNNNTNLRLVDGKFDKLYSVNGAQTNVYQLAEIDAVFARRLLRRFNIYPGDRDAIYDIDPEKLREFAIQYYNDKGVTDNIHQLISKDDPLYGVSGTRGFFHVGHLEFFDTNPEFEGIRVLVDDLPDEEIQKVQEFVLQFSDDYKDGGFKAVATSMTGLDVDLMMDLKEDPLSYFSRGNELTEMLNDAEEKIPHVLDKIHYVIKHSDVLLGALVQGGYMAEEEKEIVVRELTGVEKDLQEIYEVIEGMDSVRDTQASGLYFSPRSILGTDIGSLLNLWGIYQEMLVKFESIVENTEGSLELIGHSHSIAEMLNAIGREKGKGYSHGDLLLFSKGTSGTTIKVNISSAVRIYQSGLANIEEQENALRQYKEAFDSEINECFSRNQRAVIGEINNMEANPTSYTYVLRKHVYFPRNSKKLEGINAHESFSPLQTNAVEDIPHSIKGQIEGSRKFIQRVRTSIEEIFKEDERVSALFDLK